MKRVFVKKEIPNSRKHWYSDSKYEYLEAEILGEVNYKLDNGELFIEYLVKLEDGTLYKVREKNVYFPLEDWNNKLTK